MAKQNFPGSKTDGDPLRNGRKTIPSSSTISSGTPKKSWAPWSSLPGKEKAALLATEPEELLQRISRTSISPAFGAVNGLDCGASCVGTCTMTCGGGTCPATRIPTTVMPAEEERYSPEFLINFQQAFNTFRR